MPFNRFRISFILLFLLFLVSFLMSLSVGEVFIKPLDLIQSLYSDTEYSLIVNHFRMPKSLAAILVGLALSVSGLLMQTLFRNPIAGPYILGISSGASLGVSFVIMGSALFATVSFVNNASVVVGALIGSVGMIFILLMVLRYVKDIMTLLIIGVMFGAFASSLSSILQYFSPDFQVKSFVLWTFGNLSNVNYSQIWIMSFFISVALIIVLFSLKGLNIMVLGSDNFSNFGINKQKLQLSILISTAVLTGIVTAFCGPIGFVGVIVPHFARIIVKTSDHTKLLPLTALIGAVLMLLSDVISQVPSGGMILPINSVTAFIGIPFVLWILLKPSNKIRI